MSDRSSMNPLPCLFTPAKDWLLCTRQIDQSSRRGEVSPGNYVLIQSTILNRRTNLRRGRGTFCSVYMDIIRSIYNPEYVWCRRWRGRGGHGSMPRMEYSTWFAFQSTSIPQRLMISILDQANLSQRVSGVTIRTQLEGYNGGCGSSFNGVRLRLRRPVWNLQRSSISSWCTRMRREENIPNIQTLGDREWDGTTGTLWSTIWTVVQGQFAIVVRGWYEYT